MFEAMDGGFYVEVEAIALSRDIQVAVWSTPLRAGYQKTPC
jgi:hypothetical protein